ncbi:dihydroxy-acid dehydratase [Shigella flexneri]
MNVQPAQPAAPVRHVHRQLDELPGQSAGSVQPGNGSLLATHADRKALFLTAGQRIVELTKRYYEQDDASALPRNIAGEEAFENAMTLDIAMGGPPTPSAPAGSGAGSRIDFTMSEIDRNCLAGSQLCKVAPSTQKYHMEDVHRAGGVLGISVSWTALACEPRREKRSRPPPPADAAADDITLTRDEAVKKMFRAGPAANPYDTGVLAGLSLGSAG